MRNSVGCLIITSNPDRTVVDTDVSSLLKLAPATVGMADPVTESASLRRGRTANSPSPYRRGSARVPLRLSSSAGGAG